LGYAPENETRAMFFCVGFVGELMLSTSHFLFDFFLQSKCSLTVSSIDKIMQAASVAEAIELILFAAGSHTHVLYLHKSKPKQVKNVQRAT
jgi:hypothetical protein